jgi:lysophospholipase L1-like esterase
MKKRRALTVFIMVACVLSVIVGHFYYNNKIEETAYAAKLELGKSKKVTTATKQESVKQSKKTSEDHFKNAPNGIAELYREKKGAGETLSFHLIGSTNTSTEDGTWAQLFTAQMTDEYGKDINVQTTSLGEMTSLEIQESNIYADLTEKKADIFLIEPVLLNDNDGISMDDTLFVLGKMISDIKATNSGAIILLQPSNPISSPVKYADQVRELEEYAKEQDIPYLDYWSSWPSVDSEEIKEYYNSETLLPNKKGHKLWAEYMVNVFK